MRKFFGELQDHIFSKETPTTLGHNLKSHLTEISKNYSNLNSEQLEMQCNSLILSESALFTEHIANKHSDDSKNKESELNTKIALKRIYEMMERYLVKNTNPQVIRITEYYNEFQNKISVSKLKDLPALVQELYIKIELLKETI